MALVSLFPATQVDSAKRDAAVWAVCKTTGYSGSWNDPAAMWAHYRQALKAHLLAVYQEACVLRDQQPPPKPADYNLELPAEE